MFWRKKSNPRIDLPPERVYIVSCSAINMNRLKQGYGTIYGFEVEVSIPMPGRSPGHAMFEARLWMEEHYPPDDGWVFEDWSCKTV